MLRLNDNYGLDERIANINEMMKAEDRKLALLDKAVLIKEQEMSNKFTYLNKQLEEYTKFVDAIFDKL
tara:strand:+ start:45388 stop:45591 length:204 start_codon:yes stop_codon:yes gene_type:complete